MTNLPGFALNSIFQYAALTSYSAIETDDIEMILKTLWLRVKDKCLTIFEHFSCYLQQSKTNYSE